VILVDANLLIYASHREAARHEAAKAWLEARLNGSARVGLPWASLLAYLRITTNPRLFERPLKVAQASAQVAAWLELPTVWTPAPGPGHGALLARLLLELGAGGNLVTDAHLAALALEHGLTLCSTDRDFAKFANLSWHNPLSL
jgi:uncharacterized protein